MREFIIIGTGALFGANIRYWVANLFTRLMGPDFPYGTLFINITGSFALGFVLALLSNRLVADPTLRLLVGTGFLGGYTTFSTFSYDTISLMQRGDMLLAVTNTLVSVLGSLTAAYIGIMLARLVS